MLAEKTDINKAHSEKMFSSEEVYTCDYKISVVRKREIKYVLEVNLYIIPQSP